MSLQESGEMYLETILILLRKKGSVRSIDVAEEMGYSKPSVSRAMGILKQGDYIRMDEGGHISLTPSGMDVATKIYERHRVLTALLIEIGVSPELAADDACRVEHVISDETFEAIKRHIREEGHNLDVYR